jgi:dTDP-4-amino-4,6-dideoxygalactose transaminase
MTKNALPSFDLKRNYARVREETLEAVNRVLDSQAFILGAEVGAFEEEMARYLEAPHAVGCASGTDALILALMALDLKPGDEVITTPYTFFATVSAIVRTGARPVFADVEEDSYNIRVDRILERIGPRTRAVLPVHLFGQMVRLDELTPALAERGVLLVEDAAQAIGAVRFVGGGILRAGAVGRMGCFSFFPTKNLGAYGDAGMVVARDDETAARLRSLRVHGGTRTYFHDEVGLNSRLDALQAAILRVRLRHLETWTEERRAAADRYRLFFAEKGLLDGRVVPPAEQPGNRHTYHQYVIRAKDRDALQAHLDAEGIGCRVYYPLALHLQPCFRDLGFREGDFPVAERLSRETLALPMFPEILPEEQERVVNAIAAFYAK